MKALVLSGGTGTRLRPFSYSTPKQLIPVANRPVLEHVLESVHSLGGYDVGLVVGGQGAQIREVVGDGSRLGLRVTYIPQDQPRGLAHAILVARPFLGDDDFVLYLGDNILAGGVVDVAARFRRDRPAAHVVVHKVTDPRPFGVAELDGNGGVRLLVEKPQHPRSDLALVGVYFFTPAVHAAVAAIRPGQRGELELTDALQWLVNQGARVQASEYSGYWRDVGRLGDLLDCNRHLLADMRPNVAGHVDAASELSGPVVVAAGASVVRSRIQGPAIIGAHTTVEQCRIGPNASVGAGCVLRAAGVADSIVMDGARITGVSQLTGSLVGRAATVGRAGRAGAHRLLVGDHCHIEIAE